MQRNLSLEKEMEEILPEEDRGTLGKLEEMVGKLLVKNQETKYHELRKERDELSAALDQEREERRRLEKNLEALSEDKEKVKTRIDQLLHRLKGIDF
jgi:septal ring factor EnvC (AmiA/AmiB activator)